jgi:N-acetylneuraminic acid mutarotase
MNRRGFLRSAIATALCARHVAAQTSQPSGLAPTVTEVTAANEPFARLKDGPVARLTPEEEAERVTTSPALPGPAGRWVKRASLPIARSEMNWAVAWAGRMHVIGGYGQGRVDRAYHHVYDPALDRWFDAAPLPRGANHVAVVADAGRVYALGGFVEQNKSAENNAYAYEVATDRWTVIAPLSRPRGAAGAVALGGRIHLVGGATDPATERASIGWHEFYDPQSDRWQALKPLPGARDHVGIVAFEGAIHVVGGRFNTFEYNTDLHHIYFPERDTWEQRASMPTARSGHGLVLYRNRLFAMGGEGGILARGQIQQAHVFGQMESYDPKRDNWESHAPMLTPRHSVGAAAIDDWIYVAGGGAITGGAVQSATNEAFTLPSV